MTLQDIVARMKQDIQNGDVMVQNNDGFRYYTDTLTQSMMVPITTNKETALLYEKVFINPIKKGIAAADPFDDLPRVSMFIGQPDTGKTHDAIETAKACGLDPLIKMCRDSLNLETLLEDFQLVNGKPQFSESVALKMLSGTDRGIIILDEFNTLLTGVMKTLQPIFDDTSTTFEYRGKIYNKNLNCKFIVTLNDKDKGISIVPDAILSRSRLKWFAPVPPPVIAKWTGVPVTWVNDLYSVYKALDLLSVFGSRQIKMLHGKSDQQAIKNHLIGVCNMKNIDSKAVELLPVQNLIAKL
jgi:hypothetical protein